jgi:hypothetical protein
MMLKLTESVTLATEITNTHGSDAQIGTEVRIEQSGTLVVLRCQPWFSRDAMESFLADVAAPAETAVLCDLSAGEMVDLAGHSEYFELRIAIPKGLTSLGRGRRDLSLRFRYPSSADNSVVSLSYAVTIDGEQMALIRRQLAESELRW